MVAKLIAANFRPRCSFCSGKGTREVLVVRRHGPGRRAYTPPEQRENPVQLRRCRECGGTGYHAVPRGELVRAFAFDGRVYSYRLGNVVRRGDEEVAFLVHHTPPALRMVGAPTADYVDRQWRIWLRIAGGFVQVPVMICGVGSWPTFAEARVALAWWRWHHRTMHHRKDKGR